MRVRWVSPQPDPSFTTTALDITSENLWQPPQSGQGTYSQITTPSTIESSPNTPRTPPTPIWASKPPLLHDQHAAQPLNRSGTGSKTQCATIRGAAIVGDTGLMSQRGVTSLPTSRPPSRSSPSEGASPGQPRPEAPATTAGQSSSGLTEGYQGSNTPQITRARSRSSIGNVLNPPEPQSANRDPTQMSSLGPVLAPAGPSSNISSRQQPSATGHEHYLGHGYPPPLADGSRRILQPRGPRAASASHTATQLVRSPRLSPGGRALPVHRDSSLGNIPRLHGHPLPPISSTASLPGTPSIAATQPARTNSQPMLGPVPHVPAMVAYPPAPQGRPWPSPGEPSQTQNIPQTLGYGQSAASSSGPPADSWHPLNQSQQQGSASGDGNEVRRGTLPDGQEIEFFVDTLSGSSKQNQKRSRNAAASDRHRNKKKVQTSDMQKEIDSLKEERETAQGRIEQLTQARDFYRDDRNRLRELVSRTPEISRWAMGPPSPPAPVAQTAITRSGANPPDFPPMDQGRPIQPQPGQYPVNERQQRVPMPQGGAVPQGTVYSSGYSHPPLPNLPMPGHPTEDQHSGPESRPPGPSRVVSGHQLPPIGTMSGPGNPLSRSMSWENNAQQNRQQGQQGQQGPWTPGTDRPNPGWATEKPGPSNPPSRQG